MPNHSRAGSRTKRFRPGFGRLSHLKVLILRTQITSQLVVQELDPTSYDEENDVTMNSEAGSNFVLLIPILGRNKPLIWNMSAMTLAELEATRQFFNALFDLTEPVVRERDKVADDAFKQGDDSYTRSYRDAPQFITRPRPKRANGEGVLQRPVGDAAGAGRGGSDG